MSTTPRTDAALLSSDCACNCGHTFKLLSEEKYDQGKCVCTGPDIANGNDGVVVLADFARTLETELAAAQQEAAHYMSVAQKATDELARLRADNLAAHQMACAAGLERDRFRAELAVSENWVEHHSKHADDLIGENVKLRADLERFTGHGLLDCHVICDQRDAAVAERDRLRAEVERLKAKIANQVDRLRTLEGATNHATGTPLSKAIARAEKAEAECLEQARLLGKSGEREADLLGKLERAEKLKKFWKEFITLMEITEESDSGNKFNPNKISSCRALDGRKLNEILVEAQKIVFNDRNT